MTTTEKKTPHEFVPYPIAGTHVAPSAQLARVGSLHRIAQARAALEDVEAALETELAAAGDPIAMTRLQQRFEDELTAERKRSALLAKALNRYARHDDGDQGEPVCDEHEHGKDTCTCGLHLALLIAKWTEHRDAPRFFREYPHVLAPTASTKKEPEASAQAEAEGSAKVPGCPEPKPSGGGSFDPATVTTANRGRDSSPRDAAAFCICELRARQWDPNTGRCRSCGSPFVDHRNKEPEKCL